VARYVWAILDRVLKESLSEGGFNQKPGKNEGAVHHKLWASESTVLTKVHR